MLTGYTTNLPTDTLFGAGVLYKGSTVLGVTEGAPDFDPGVEIGDINFDDKPSRLKGTVRRVGFTPVIKGMLKEFGPSASGNQIGNLETASSEATASGVTTITPKAAGPLIASGAYLTDVRWIFQRASGGYAAIWFPIAHVRKWTKKGMDKKEAQISFEIIAVGDPVKDLGTAPYAIEIRTVLPNGSITYVSDGFTRADNASSLGNATTGQAWSALSGVGGILGNQAYFASLTAGIGLAVVDAGVSDGFAELTAAVTGGETRLPFRVTDINNYLFAYWNSVNFTIWKIVSGASSNVLSQAGTFANGDRLGIRMAGSGLSLVQNGTVIASATEAFNSTATKHGIGAGSTGTRFSAFKVTN